MVALSVVLPVRDAEPWLDMAITSVLGQTFRDFELLIIDDGSCDGSAGIAARHAADDNRVVLLKNTDSGLISALNYGLAQARAPLIARMDADDIASPERFARQMEHMHAAGAGLLVLGTGYVGIDRAGRRGKTVIPPLGHEEIATVLMRVNPMSHPGVLMRRDAVIEAGGYRRAYLRCEDYDLWLRLAECGRIENLAEPLLEYRLGHVPFSAANLERQVLSEMAARSAARLRRSGQVDPTGAWIDIDASALSGLGIGRERIARETARRALQAARQCRKLGDVDGFRAALALADAQRRNGIGNRLEYLLRRLKAVL